MLTDDDLFTRYLEGDGAAFQCLHDRYAATVWLTVCRITRDPHLADDAMQDAFAAVHNARGSYKVGSNFRSWLYQIARNSALASIRRKDDVREFSSDSIGGDVSVEVEEREVRELVGQVVAELLPGYRKLIEMYYFEGLSNKEIAEKLDIAPVAARRRLHNACAEFRKRAAPKLGL